MQIQSGKLYENRTWKYLYPCLKSYGMTLRNYLNSFYKLAVGVGDSNIDIEDKQCMYILLDTNVSTSTTSLTAYRENLSRFLEWLRFQPYYVIDYIYSDKDYKGMHMIVIQIPQTYHKTLQLFKQGKYSEMYDRTELNNCFALVTLDNKELQSKINNKLTSIRSILTKNPNYIPTFKEELKKEFDVNLLDSELIHHELDFPPNVEEEVFNFKKELV